jgi:hypothetical protein
MSLENVEIRTLTLLLSLLALGALGLVACDGGDDEDSATQISPEHAIEQAGNEWAASFAAGGPGASCENMTQPACERMDCERAGGSTIRNCTPPSPRFRVSFKDATIQDVAIERGEQAAARFSNGETVELAEAGGSWLIQGFDENGADTTTEAQVPQASPTDAKPSREQVQELRREANEWASLFAANTCNKYMGQPICVALTPVSEAFQESFADATVEDIALKASPGEAPFYPYIAAVKFSNGVVVFFGGGRRGPEPPAGSCAGPGGGCDWNLAEPDVNRRFIEAATTPP